ncbi:MAG TPA: glycosyltransferase family 4 protein [Stellaceae bacterium]|nr:glycosyltransferase family 4 protein [Stellaceae bacterium]
MAVQSTSSETSIASAAQETGRPPAVLQVLPRLEQGGVERGTVEVAAALTQAGWRAVVASAGGRMVGDILRAGAEHVELPLATKNPAGILMNVRRLASLIEAENIDIVHARSRAPAWSAMLAARRTGRHFVTTFHNAYGAGSWAKRRYNSVMARGERVIAISHFVGAHAAALYGVGDDRLRVIDRGVDLDQFNPDRVNAARIVQLSRAWRLPDGAPVVMLPGRLTSWKGHGVLIEALSWLGRRDLVCVFVGGGSERYRRTLQRQIAALDLGGVCKFVDHCADMPAAYMLADAVVSASTRPEGFGRVIAEAMAMGRPVVASDHGGASEIVADRDTGWLVPPGDAKALARALQAALSLGAGERASLARRAIASVAERFSREAMTRRTIAVYEEILWGE